MDGKEMTPTPEQIEAAREWFDQCYNPDDYMSTVEILATYAAHCIAEATAEKDAEIARLRSALTAVAPGGGLLPACRYCEETEKIARAALQETKP